MTREIKFRSWDKILKIMSYNPVNAINFNGQFLLNDGKFHDINKTDYILMQYTGLKDKNGKEIYEGDILKHIPAFEANYFVKYLTGGFYLCPDNKDYGEYFASLFAGYDYKNRCNSIEIIGNIYENPELIGDKND